MLKPNVQIVQPRYTKLCTLTHGLHATRTAKVLCISMDEMSKRTIRNGK